MLACNFMDEISLNNCWQQCCKSYSTQEVLEAAQASQHFRSIFSFSACLFVCLGFPPPPFFFVLFGFWFFWQSCVRASESLRNIWGCLTLVPAHPFQCFQWEGRDWRWSAQPGILDGEQQHDRQERGEKNKPSIFPHLLASRLGCAAAAAPASPQVSFSHLYHGKVGITLTRLPHRGVVRTNQLTRLKCLDFIKHYNKYYHNYY